MQVDELVVKNLTFYRDQCFDEYIKMPGISYSSIKGFVGEMSKGMQLGERVHHYLNEPKKYDWQQVEIVKPIAAAIRQELGEAFQYLEKELAFTAEFHYSGMKMLYKGRADAIKVPHILVDYKVLSGNLAAAVNIFGYDRQLSGYCLATGCKKGYIIAWNKNKRQIEKKIILPEQGFWKIQVLRFGVPA